MGIVRTREPSGWQRLRWWFMAFRMCNCPEPRYVVIEGILRCDICRKPANWYEDPKRKKRETKESK